MSSLELLESRFYICVKGNDSFKLRCNCNEQILQTIKVHGVKHWVLLVALFRTTHGQTHNGGLLFGTKSALQNVRYSHYMFYIMTGLMTIVPLM